MCVLLQPDTDMSTRQDRLGQRINCFRDDGYVPRMTNDGEVREDKTATDVQGER